ncbi:prolyl-tRNA synthetase [Patescibacteria group bacterium]|nr:prolyl-tRNA synthetase [Patescibacteria group bacterium]
MLYSELVGKTKKEAPKDEESINAKLLIRGGFIHKEISGAYIFLPLGLRVLNNVVRIIREEMEAIGGQEMALTALQNPESWKTTNRWADDVIDIWFKTELNSGAETGLATTHEEPLTKLLTQHISSYKDLPIYLFQFQTKFRNELRAQGGLLRTREFLMKDLYSFNKNKEDFEKYYEKAKQAYIKIWDRLGIGDQTYVTFASGGSFGKFSHEFQTVCEIGEDIIYIDKEKKIAVNKEVYNDDVLKELDLKKEDLEKVRGIEVGNIFPLGTRFSEALGLFYTDEKGNKKPVVMGSYGIGPGRVIGTIVELSHDDRGIIWPENIAPYKVSLIGIGKEIEKKVQEIYKELEGSEIEVLFDDRREVTPGQKFADADLIGIPYRVVVSEKTEDRVELKKRDKDKTELVTVKGLIKLLN